MTKIFEKGTHARVKFDRSVCSKLTAEKALTKLNTEIINKLNVSNILFLLTQTKIEWLRKNSIVTIDKIENYYNLNGEYPYIHSQSLCVYGVWYPARLFDTPELTKRRKLQFGQ